MKSRSEDRAARDPLSVRILRPCRAPWRNDDVLFVLVNMLPRAPLSCPTQRSTRWLIFGLGCVLLAPAGYLLADPVVRRKDRMLPGRRHLTSSSTLTPFERCIRGTGILTEEEAAEFAERVVTCETRILGGRQRREPTKNLIRTVCVTDRAVLGRRTITSVGMADVRSVEVDGRLASFGRSSGRRVSVHGLQAPAIRGCGQAACRW